MKLSRLWQPRNPAFWLMVVLNLLSVAAAYGLLVVFFKWGAAEWFGLIAFDQIEGWIPVFVFAMVFGHAPIIFPAVLRVTVPYHPVFYAPLVLLQASLALRVAGDAAGAGAATPCARK